MRLLSSRRPSRLKLLAVGGLALALGGCASSDSGFAQGRACRIGERMIAAVTAGDESAAGDEVRRLDALDGSDEQFDLDEIEQVAGGGSDDSVDDLRELFDDGGCDLDRAGDDDPTPVTIVPVTTTTTLPTSSEPPTGTSAPAPDTSSPPFTLPIPTGTTPGPGTERAAVIVDGNHGRFVPSLDAADDGSAPRRRHAPRSSRSTSERSRVRTCPTA